MSFLPINEENQEAPKGQTTNAPIPPPQTSSSAGTGPGIPKPASAGSPTQFGSSASKLGAYLEANAPQITQQADTITGNLNQQYGNVSQDITNAANQFGQQVQGGYTANNPDLVSQALQNPADFASNPGNIQAFQKLYNNAYTGPLNFEGTSPYSDIQGQIAQAVQQANLLGTEAGLQSYLQGQGNNPNRASATLDTLLLRGNPQAQESIRNAANQFGGLNEQLQTAVTGADQSVLDAQKAAQESRAYTQGQINPYAEQFQQGLGENLTQSEAARAAYNAAVNKNQTTAQDYRTRLLEELRKDTEYIPTRLQYTNTPDPTPFINRYKTLVDPSEQISGLAPYLQNNSIVNPATLANATSLGDYQKDAALRQLIGGGYQSVLDQANIGQAGTATPIPGTVGSPTDPTGQLQYMRDILRMFSNSYIDPVSQAGGPRAIGPNDPFLTMNPAQLASNVITARQYQPNYFDTAIGGPGVDLRNATPYIEALNRLVANQYQGRT